MEIVYKRVGEIRPYEKNPRRNDEAVKYVAESIKQFGFKVPIVIDSDGVIIAGHTRFKAVKKLGLEKVPCIIADDLTEEQVNAFRLADNKVAEKAEWDFDLLDEEIELLPDFDFEALGFGFDEVKTEEEIELEHEQHKEETLRRCSNILNLDYMQFPGEGKYDIPIIEPVYHLPEIKEWIGFNYVLSDKNPEGKGVHFFVDDYQFERVWNTPDRYIEKLSRYAAVMAPDFSPYADMPLCPALFNHYRKHWFAAYMQYHGITVIPVLRGSYDERYYEFCLDGNPKNSIVAISAMWTNSEERKNAFAKEYDFFYDALKPSKVLLYGGGEIEGLRGDVERIKTFTEKRWKKDG